MSRILAALALAAAFLLATLSAHATPAFVQGCLAPVNTSSATSISCTMGATVASGDAVVCWAFWGSGTSTQLTSITDDKSNSYTQEDVKADGTNVAALADELSLNLTNGPKTFTANFSPAVAFITIGCEEYSGIATSSAVDGHAINEPTESGTGTLTSSSITTGSNGDLVWAVVADASGQATSGSGYTAGSGYTVRHSITANDAEADEDQVQSAAGAITASFSSGSVTNDTAIIAILALKASVVVASPPQRTLIGVGQ